MTRWAKNVNNFKVSLSKSKNKDGSYSKICRVPKPILDILKATEYLEFKITKSGKITVERK